MINMPKNGVRLSRYCYNLIVGPLDRHPYFNRAIRDDGSIDIDNFLVSYQRFLDYVPTKKSVKGLQLREREKRILLLRAGSESYQKSMEEIGREFDVGRERIRQIEGRLLSRFRSPDYKAMMDTLYLEEFDTLTAQGIQPTGFDIEYVEYLRDKARRDAYLAEHSIEILGLSTRPLRVLEEAGIIILEDLERKSKDDLLKLWSLGPKSLKEIQQKLRDYHSR